MIAQDLESVARSLPLLIVQAGKPLDVAGVIEDLVPRKVIKTERHFEIDLVESDLVVVPKIVRRGDLANRWILRFHKFKRRVHGKRNGQRQDDKGDDAAAERPDSSLSTNVKRRYLHTEAVEVGHHAVKAPRTFLLPRAVRTSLPINDTWHFLI